MSAPERGTSASLEAIAWIAERVGRPVARLLFIPITIYFLITAHAARRASCEFLKRARGGSVHWGMCCAIFIILPPQFWIAFICCVVNSNGSASQFTGKRSCSAKWKTAKAAILLGSHLGSFEVLRALGVMQRSFSLKVLMDTAHNENISRFFDALNPMIAETVIAPDRPDTLIKARESLDASYFIGMLGDRVFGADKTTRCDFLGAPTTLPSGPMLLAAMMHCPVILFFGLYRGGNRYDIHFEHFADEIVLNREHRAEEIQSWMQRYVARLEHYARLAPYNWFNFYSFWD